MTYGAFSPGDFASFDVDDRAPRKPMSQVVPCILALAICVSAGSWLLFSRPIAGSTASADVGAAHTPVVDTANLPVAVPHLRRDAWLFDPQLTSGQTPMTFAHSAPLRASFEPRRQVAAAPAPVPAVEERVAEAETIEQESAEPEVVPALPNVPAVVRDVPLPMPRPALLASTGDLPSAASRRAALQANRPAAGSPEQPSFFDKMFGKTEAPAAVLAYAAPESTGLNSVLADRAASYDRTTAIYDISAHTVYLPDGSRLEAHSGLGARLDDPRGVAQRMRGATPPNVYDLKLREALFHGVRALRLTPVGSGNTYGRAGLLAHTFMLGPRGDSNGCVVFRNYKAFLDAYESGRIRRLAVVARMT